MERSPASSTTRETFREIGSLFDLSEERIRQIVRTEEKKETE